MSLSSDLTAIKNLSDGVKNNKVTRFAYTQNAYNNNDVNGHSDYVYDRDNNIPTADLSVIEVNPTVVDKGFRARASSLTRMLLNHLFGRISYNLNKVNDLFNELLVKVMANMGVANGLATLDANGRIPYSQLPEDAMEYQGEWNAQTNTPHLADGTGTRGDTYNVSVAGTQDLGSGDITFFVGDRVVYNENGVWQRLQSGSVQSVCDIFPDQTTGNVDLTQQTDVTKVLNSDFLAKLFKATLGWQWEAGAIMRLAQILSYPEYLIAYQLTSNPVNQELPVNGNLVKSTNGKNWTTIQQNINRLIQVTANSIVACNSGAVNPVYISRDSGATWSRWGSDTYNLHDVCEYEDDYSLIATSNGLYRVFTRDMGNPYSLSTTQFYYLHREKRRGQVICGSTSGLYFIRGMGSYTPQASNITSGVNPYFIESNSSIIIVGNRNANGAYYSEDSGETWTACTGAVTSRKLYFAKYVNGVWVGATDSGVVYSTNGKAWTLVSITFGNCYTLDYVNGMFIAGCGGSPYWSEDGINWQTGAKSSNKYFGVNNAINYAYVFPHYSDLFYHQIAYADGMFIAVGNDTIWESKEGRYWEESKYTISGQLNAVSDKLNDKLTIGGVGGYSAVGELITLGDVVAQIDGE